jgi:hypothetical protein
MNKNKNCHDYMSKLTSIIVDEDLNVSMINK